MDPEASVLGGDFQSCDSRRKLDFDNDGEFPEINVVSGDEGDQNGFQKSTPTVNDIGLIHSRISKESIPQLDMDFLTEEAAYNFYNSYAYKVGFSIRRHKDHRDKSGKITSRTFCCSCEGKRGADKRDVIVKCHRSETRFGCLARMKIRYCRVTQKYLVFEFGAVHNHTLCSPSKTHLFRSHRNFAPAQALEADMANDSGIAPKAIVEFMAKQVGGRENLGFIPQDYKNYLRSKRSVQMKMGDTGGVLEFLQKMQLEDPNFFYAIQVDEDDLITNIFWADAKMRADYASFGDVVCFDTTYRKNKEGRPFAMFVGANHHKQTTVFGAALLYDETAETFCWLFDTFCTAMSGKMPKTILTDQDAAMAKALASKWPETVHRLCIWHIYQNAAKQLSGVFAEFKDFAKDFSSCIYDYEDEADFIIAWNEMLATYGLQENDWLRRMYSMKEKWALVYGRQTFCADMTTTQRSESMNNVLKKYVSYKNDLLQFFHHFQRLIDDRRYEELKADFRATQSIPCLSFPVQILRHAASVYTPKVFELFRAELCKAWDCNMDEWTEDGTVTTYKITPYRKSHHHVVTYDSTEGTVSCSCKKFEFVGILCAHALKVLSSKRIVKIPDRYILKRWTMNAKSGNTIPTCLSSILEDPTAMMGRRYKELCRLHTHLATRAAETEKAYGIVVDGLNKLLEEVEASLTGVEIDEGVETNETFLGSQNGVFEDNETHDEGIGKKVKGLKVKEKTNGKSSKRPKSALERATRNKKKPQVRPSSDCGNFVIDPPAPNMFNHHQMHQQFVGSSGTTLDGPLDQNVFHSSQHLSQQLNTRIHNQSLDASLDWNSLIPLSQLTQLSQLGQLGPQHHFDVLHAMQRQPPHGYEGTYFNSFQDRSQQK